MGGDTELLVVLARAHANPSRVGHLLVYHAVELSTGLYRTCTFTRRWCSRRDGRTRTRDTQCWKLLFWPLNYIPIQTENRPLGLPLRAAPGRAF